MEESSGSRPIQEGLVTKQTSPSIQTREALSDVQENARTKGNEETRNDEENYKNEMREMIREGEMKWTDQAWSECKEYRSIPYRSRL